MGTAPRLNVNGGDVEYDGRCVGQYGVDESSGEIVVIFWKPLFRIENSYALTVDIEEELGEDIKTFYVFDTDSEMVYRFPRETYFDANIRHMNGQSQFVPDRDENTGVWDADDVLL